MEIVIIILPSIITLKSFYFTIILGTYEHSHKSEHIYQTLQIFVLEDTPKHNENIDQEK